MIFLVTQLQVQMLVIRPGSSGLVVQRCTKLYVESDIRWSKGKLFAIS